jgi:hypothetical protein
MTSPTQRTLKFLRDTGATARVVEHWNGYAKRRIDLWGADILARQGQLLMAIQTTSDSNHSDRVEKAKANPDTLNWLGTGVPFYVFSWGKKGARNKRKLWTVRITQLSLTDDNKIITLTHGSEIPNT